jgi:hypothetical protein
MLGAREHRVLCLAELRSDLRGDIAALRAELIKWAVGIGIAGVVLIGGMILSATLALLRAIGHG